MSDAVYGFRWNSDMRFMIDAVSEDEARARYTEGPWFSVAVGEGLLTSPETARTAEASGAERPVPEFSLEILPGAERAATFFYDEHGSVQAIYQWRRTDDSLFLTDVLFYEYPDDNAFHGQNEARVVTTITFSPDGTSREVVDDDDETLITATDRRDVDVTKNLEPIPVFGDWSGLGRADREAPPGT